MKPLFTEKQRFTQWWLWLIMLLITADIAQHSLYPAIIHHNWVVHKFDVIGLCIPISAMALIFSIRLSTQIDGTGIHYRFIPFHLTPRNIMFEEVSNLYIRRYSPIAEYGGWGMRYGFFGGRGRALNISGNIGLQIEFKDGRKLLLGTQKPEEIDKLLHQLVASGVISPEKIIPAN